MSIGRIIVSAGAFLSLFGGAYAEVGAFLVQLGTGILAGNGTVGPIRVGSTSITATVAPWTG